MMTPLVGKRPFAQHRVLSPTPCRVWVFGGESLDPAHKSKVLVKESKKTEKETTDTRWCDSFKAKPKKMTGFKDLARLIFLVVCENRTRAWQVLFCWTFFVCVILASFAVCSCTEKSFGCARWPHQSLPAWTLPMSTTAALYCKYVWYFWRKRKSPRSSTCPQRFRAFKASFLCCYCATWGHQVCQANSVFS